MTTKPPSRVPARCRATNLAMPGPFDSIGYAILDGRARRNTEKKRTKTRTLKPGLGRQRTEEGTVDQSESREIAVLRFLSGREKV